MNNADLPLSRREDDRLARSSLISHLTRMLIAGKGTNRRATRLVVGLTGAWGAGKSSILSLLSEHLRTLANVFVVEFNPWLFQGRDDLLEAFFVELSAQLSGNLAKDGRAMLRALQKYRNAIEPVVKY